MRKEQIEQVKEKLNNIISRYKTPIDRLTTSQVSCRKIHNQLQDKEFKLYNQEKYLEWEDILVQKQDILFVEKYYEDVLRKVFYQLSVEVIGLFFQNCKNRRDITDFEKIMEYNKDERKYPYILNLRFLNDTIEVYLRNNYNTNISFRYYNNSIICKSEWNSNKGKWEDVVYYENFPNQIESEYHQSYINRVQFNYCINYNIKEVISEFKALKELELEHKKEIEDLMKKHQEERNKKDIYGLYHSF